MKKIILTLNVIKQMCTFKQPYNSRTNSISFKFCATVVFVFFLFKNQSGAQDSYTPITLSKDSNTINTTSLSEKDKQELIKNIELFLGEYKEIASFKDYNAPGGPTVTAHSQRKFKQLFDDSFNANIYDDLSYTPTIIKLSDYVDKVASFSKGISFDINDAYLVSIVDQEAFYEAKITIAKLMYHGFNKKGEPIDFEKGKDAATYEELILTIQKSDLSKIKINTIKGDIVQQSLARRQYFLANARYGIGLPEFTTGNSFSNKEGIDLQAGLLASIGGEFRLDIKNGSKLSLRLGAYFAMSNYTLKFNNTTEINDPKIELRTEAGEVINGEWKNTLFLNPSTNYTLQIRNIEIPIGINWKIKSYWNSDLNLELAYINNIGMSQGGKLKGDFDLKTIHEVSNTALCTTSFKDKNQDITYQKQSYSNAVRVGFAWQRDLVQDRIRWFVLADYTHYLKTVTLGDQANGLTDGADLAGFKFGLPEIKPNQINLSLGIIFWLNKNVY